ncbi:pectate lyase [Pontibacter saemangeumensis]|uniref:Pectate lyase n=1 Tax=Pontibacter saemangeumensis TaxID=1084525 RepID=A0ABP8M239_9BACT
MAAGLEQRAFCFKASDYFKSSLHALVQAGMAAAFYLVCCISATGCAGPGQTATTGSAVAVPQAANTATAAEPVRWGRALLQQEQDWYSSAEAIRIADNLLLYQRANGGWHKNTDMATVLSDEKKEALASAAEKRGASTIDNSATFTQMEYLARVYQGTGQEKYKESFLRGMDYLLEAQYANGGWPQFYPVRKGYYEHITFNDGAMIGVMRLLRDVAHQKNPYTFVDDARRSRAAEAIEKGLDVILQAQIKAGGRLTAWCAQHDRVDLTPQKARAYELPSISGGESAAIVKYLMEIENPGPEIIRAVESAVSWFERVKIMGIRLERVKEPVLHKGYDVVVVEDPAAPPLWARFYEIGTNRPMFVGRDGIVREALSGIEQERRAGYSWYVNSPQELLEKDFPAWKQKWVATK